MPKKCDNKGFVACNLRSPNDDCHRADLPCVYPRTERDKALTEVMGECWHEWTERRDLSGSWDYCQKCEQGSKRHTGTNNDFSTWDGFGKLVMWAKKQDWWEEFCANLDPLKTFGCWEALVDPDRFANAVFEFLKPCCDHEWGTDGLHSNIFCKKCFKSQN